MNVRIDLQELISEIEKSRKLIDKNLAFHNDFQRRFVDTQGKETAFAMTLSQIFIDFYTCLETLFFRISQVFENNLQQEKWHKSLLHKMALHIEGVRIAVIRDETFTLLDELLRFRHFRRYYFDFDYDWERIELLQKKYLKVIPLVVNDLSEFENFLADIISCS